HFFRIRVLTFCINLGTFLGEFLEVVRCEVYHEHPLAAAARNPPATAPPRRCSHSAHAWPLARIEQLSNSHRTSIEPTSNAQRTRIQLATNLHPTCVSVRDHRGLLMTVSD